jgi:hypothetical protein
MPSLPTADKCPPNPTALSLTLKLHTHTPSPHMGIHTRIHTPAVTLGEREGDANKGSGWTGAMTLPPHPPYPTMNK